MLLKRLGFVLLVAALFGQPFAYAQDDEAPLQVVATYSILGDIVQNVAGDQVELTVLVGPDGDAHTFEPTPQDGIRLLEADVIFENGLEFETWLDDLYEASESEAVRVDVSAEITPLGFEEGGHTHSEEGDHEHESEEADGGYFEGELMVAARLLVNDYESGAVHVLDLRSGEVVATYELGSRATLYPSANARYGFAVQTSANAVSVIDSGVARALHDDHWHTELGEPALLDFTLEGQRPIHFVIHHDEIAIFNDGSGSADIFTEDRLFDSTSEILTLTSARPHHGVAVPLGEVVLLSTPNPEDEEDSLPIGVDALSRDGEILASFHECPGLHGEASYGENGVAFACSDGILLVEANAGELTSRKLAYPTTNPDFRAGTLYVGEGAQYLIGNYSDSSLIRIDPVAGTVEEIPVPVRPWRFAPYGVDKAVVLTIDGALHVIEIATGEIEGSVAVVDAFVPPSRAAARPTFVISGDTAYVSDPLPGDIATVDLTSMTVAETRIFVGGKPSSLAAVGLMAVSEMQTEEGDHDHEGDEHGHDHGEFDPHIWQNPLHVITMTENVRDALIAADPDNADIYTANAEAYIAQLQALDSEIEALVASVPAENRKLITSHDALGYFADRYGFEVVVTVLPASTEAADPSAREVIEIIETIQAEGIPAVFIENVANPDLMTQIAEQAGVDLAPPLFTDALGAQGSEGSTYLDMMRYNAQVIVSALGQ